MKKLYSFFVLFFVLINLTNAQSKVYKGLVQDQYFNAEFATVTNKTQNLVTQTDDNGKFKISAQVGDTISVSGVGLQNQEKVILSTTVFLKFILQTPPGCGVEVINFDEITVTATKAQDTNPFSFTNKSHQELNKNNLGQDMPILLNQLPNVVTTSDAGAGVGYTGIRVRGSDATRVNVTINGIPLNDSESQGTYWVDIPDIVSSVSSLQLQRGVGTSTNGTGAFGASLNLLTSAYHTTPSFTFNNSFGSFNTRKHSIGFQTGKLRNAFSFKGRLSKIKSDGYIDRAHSDLNSYYFAGTYLKDKTLIKFLAFGGHEKTYQSWNGIDSATIKSSRTFNSAGAKYDENWNVIGYYDNEVDDYTQNHYQLHLNQQLTDAINGNIAFHYTKGYGYYEQYKQHKKLSDYGISPTIVNMDTIKRSDLIRRKWLDNDFYGLTTTFVYDNKKGYNHIIGGSWNRYDGDHFGRVIWARNAGNSEIRHKYYNNNGLKDDLALFTKVSVETARKLILFADLQYRNVQYKTTSFLENDVNAHFNFFNPKLGITYKISKKANLYYSFAKAHKEPNRSDYEYAVTPPQPEALNDHEVGFRFSNYKLQAQGNLYYMKYKNQLVLTGEIDDVGNFIRTNVGESYRLGLEIDMNYQVFKNFYWSPNLSLSQNQNVDFIQKTSDSTSVNLGNTHISYSPNIVAGNTFAYQIDNKFGVSFTSKYIGSQYLANNEADVSKLAAYSFSNLQANWTFGKKNMFTLKMLINNIFDSQYASNGYMWGTTAYYYPQAGRNYLIGLDFKLY